MKKNLEQFADQTILKTRKRKVRRRILALLSVFVLFVTTNQLIFAADTLEHIAACGLAEHTHTEACYGPDGELNCGLKEHEHTDACYQERPKAEAKDAEEPVDAEDEGEETSEEPYELDEFELGAEEEEEVLAEVGFQAEETQDYEYTMGSQPRVSLDEILEKAGLSVEGSIDAGQVVDESHPEGMIDIERDGNDIAIVPTRDFKRVELAVMTDDAFYTVNLLNAVVPDEAAEAEAEETEEQTPVGENEEETEVGDEADTAEENAPAEENEDEVSGEDAEAEAEAEDTTETENTTETIETVDNTDEETVVEDEEAPAAEEGENENKEEAAPAEDMTEEPAADESENENNEEAAPAEDMTEEPAADESENENNEEVAPAEDVNEEPAAEEGENVEEAAPAETEEESAAEPDAEEASAAEPAEEDEAEAPAPVDKKTIAATIDLTDAVAPFSLKAWMAQAQPEEEAAEAESVEEETAVEEEATVEEEAAGEAPEALPVDAWTLEYDAAVFAVEPAEADYIVTPLCDFESAAFAVETGDQRIELTLTNWTAPEEALLEAAEAVVYAATIDLTAAAAPFSLADWMAQARPEDAEEPVPAEEWEIEYDAAIFTVDPAEGDYSVTPAADFEEAAIAVKAGEVCYELTLVNYTAAVEVPEVLAGKVAVDVEGADYSLLISVPEEAELPADATFKAVAVNDETYNTAALGAIERDEGMDYTVLATFDLTIYDGETPIQPKAALNVGVDFGGKLDADMQVVAVHFPGTGAQAEAPVEVEEEPVLEAQTFRAPLMAKRSMMLEAQSFAFEEEAVGAEISGTETLDATNDGNGVASFQASSFSVYAVVGGKAITTQVETASGETLQVTVEVSNANDVARLEGLRVNELAPESDAYLAAYDAVAAAKRAEDENFDEESMGFFAADIELLDANGEAFEPEGTVDIKFELISLPASESTLISTMEVQHLAEQDDGTVDVETVATSDDVTKVDDIVTAEFSVDSFSTFTLTWTGDGSAEVISDQDAMTTLNIRNNGTTYATVNVHYVDVYGNNIRSPFTSPVNGDTPVTIEGLLNDEIAGYAYEGAYYNYKAATGEGEDQAIASIAVSRTETQTEGTEIVRVGNQNANGGRIAGIADNNNQPAGYTQFYSDANGNTQIYWITGITGNQNNRFHTRTNNLANGTRYNGPVYGARRGTVTNYNYELTFDNDEIAALTNSNTTGTWQEAADIYLVYESTDTNLKHATIHFGTLNPDGSFTELDESASLDTDAASISLKSTISGYDYVGAYYSETATETPSADTVTIMPTIKKVDDVWQYTETSQAGETGIIADGSHIYASFKEKTGSGTPTPSEGEIPKPTTVKNVTDNGDGTYDIQLDIIGEQLIHEETKGANVLLIFDRTSSMSQAMAGAPDGNRISAAKKAVHTLVDALNPSKNPVQMAVFSFDRNANDPLTDNGSYWTTNGESVTDFTDALTLAPSGATPGYGGTNWEAAFAKAKTVLATADADPTYVIFMTDGNPTFYVGSNQGVRNNRTANDPEYTRARTEASGLNNSLKIYGILCANASDGPLLQTLVNDLKTAAYGSHDATHILADNEATLTSTFNNIAQHIVNQLNASDVSTNDGVTSLSHVSASVSGAAGAFTYYKAYEVTEHDDGTYTYMGDDGKEHAISAGNVQEYTFAAADGTPQSYLYYNRQEWAGAPGASYNEATGVTWDLSSQGALNGGAIYSVRFTIWPSQAAYDLLADLNNGIKVYEAGHANSITAEERDQVYESGGVYYMKTNTNLDTTYTFGKDTYTDGVGYHQGAMDLDAETISLKKNWPENMLDNYGAATYRDENGVEHTATEIELTLLKDGDDYYDVTVKADEGWKKDDISISCGVMTVHEGKVDIKEPGHDYTVTEPAGFSYYWDLIADVYHPMVINGVTTMLILDEDVTEADVDNVNCFEIDGKIYRVDSAKELVLEADNYRRSNLNLTKAVDAKNAPKDAWFEYTVVVKDADSTDGYVWFSAWDPVAEATVKDVEWIISGATAEEGNTGYWYASNGGTIVLKIKAGWNVRFLNLKHDSTFSFIESDPGEGFTYEKAVSSTQYPLKNQETWCTIDADARKVEGTIVEPNNAYTITYTNKWNTIDIQLAKVDENNNPLRGSTFDLMRGEEKIASYSPDTTVDLGGLGIGIYRLVERIAPQHYDKAQGVYFEVYKDTDGSLKARLVDESGNVLDDQSAITSEAGTDGLIYTITVKDARTLVDVVVKKTIVNISDLPDDFNIIYTGYTGGVAMNRTTASDNGNGEYQWTIEDVPAGTEITFTEAGYEVDGYTAEAAAGDGDESVQVGDNPAVRKLTVTADDDTVAYKNTYTRDKGKLTITKTTTPDTFTRPYQVQVTNQAGQYVSVADGKAVIIDVGEGGNPPTMTITVDAPLVIDELPADTYTVTEITQPEAGNVDVEGYRYDGTTYQLNDAEATETYSVVVLKKDDAHTVAITNKYTRLATVKVVKKVEGFDRDKAAEFDFTQTGLTDYPEEFTLRGSDDEETEEIENLIVFGNIPYETVFSIAEADTYADFNTTIVISKGETQEDVEGLTTGKVTVDSDEVTITYTNTRNQQKVMVYKYDSISQKELPGAFFTLEGSTESAINYEGMESGDDGFVEYQGEKVFVLPAGSYTLTETEAPDGYNMMSETVNITISTNDVTATGDKGTSYTVVPSTEDPDAYVIRIPNNPGFVLPSTGGVGTTVYTASGIAMILLAAALLIAKRRRA